MKLKIKQLIFVFCFLQINFLAAQSLSFQEAQTIMKSNNKKLEGFKEQFRAAEYKAKQAKGLYFPSFKINANFIHLAEDLSVNLNSQRAMAAKLLHIPKPELLGNWEYTLKEQNFGSVALEGKMPLFTGGKIRSAVKASKINRSIKSKAYQETENALITELATRYFQLQMAKEAVKVREEALKMTEKHYYNAQKLEEKGMISGVQTLNAKASLAEAKRNLEAAKYDVNLAKNALQGTLGTDTDIEKLSTPLFIYKELKPISYFEEEAKKHFPSIEKLYLQQKLADVNIKAQKADFLPTIALVGKKYLYTKNFSITEPDNWYVGVGLTYNIFDGLQRINKIREAKSIKKSVELFTEQAQRDIQTLVRKQYQELLKQSNQYHSLEKELQFAEELLRVRKKAFLQGLATSTNVVEASLFLSSIRLKRLVALYKFDTYLASLLETCGQSENLKNYMIQIP